MNRKSIGVIGLMAGMMMSEALHAENNGRINRKIDDTNNPKRANLNKNSKNQRFVEFNFPHRDIREINKMGFAKQTPKQLSKKQKAKLKLRNNEV